MEFKQFDVVEEVAKDHYYLKHEDHKRSDDKIIMREWKILEKNLPESIYVQTYESRMDLLRAVIVGCDETPYHDALFFFDISLPRDYPNQPPRVYYHSHGYRVNPNLYMDGNVCISLLNTTIGTEDEKWRKTSTILQVLVSIQGLVLNQTPYFNYTDLDVYRNDSSPRWANASKDYNQNAFVLCWKTMLKIMKKPPEKFDDFVVHHFQARKVCILRAIENYKKGHAMVGSQLSQSPVGVSPTFEACLVDIDEKLKTTFATLMEPSEKTRKGGIINRFIQNWKKGICWKMTNYKSKVGKD